MTIFQFENWYCNFDGNSWMFTTSNEINASNQIIYWSLTRISFVRNDKIPQFILFLQPFEY